MKKLIALSLVLVLAVMAIACDPKTENPSATQEPSATEEVTQTAEPATTTEPTAASNGATELLVNIWAAFDESQKFAVAGGDAENAVMDAPGAFSTADAEALDATLAVPADAAAYIDEAASLMHMMNANTFTAGAFHVKDAANQAAFVEALKTNVLNRQWMCGFPDTLVIYTIGEYVVSAFGEATNIENLKANIVTAYADAVLAAEENLAA